MGKILVVDDSETMRTPLKELLTKENHQVFEAENGEVAIEILKKNKDIQLIFTDLHMPEMDGLCMSNLILTDNDLKNVSIVMLTTEATGDLKSKAKTIGIKGWIPKPYKNESVLLAVKKFVKP